MRRLTHVCGRRAGIVMIALAGSACGSSPITAARIEASVARTFANLVQVQLTRIGLPAIAASDLHVTASCSRTAGGVAGSGEWMCSLIWSGPNGAVLRDMYDLSVAPDGCYTAAVDSAEGQLGGPTIRTADGADVRNLLYNFEA